MLIVVWLVDKTKTTDMAIMLSVVLVMLDSYEIMSVFIYSFFCSKSQSRTFLGCICRSIFSWYYFSIIVRCSDSRKLTKQITASITKIFRRNIFVFGLYIQKDDIARNSNATP